MATAVIGVISNGRGGGDGMAYEITFTCDKCGSNRYSINADYDFSVFFVCKTCEHAEDIPDDDD
ncbi:hypothetical protein [Aneurinibacillus aneurinilyticus]